MRWASIPAIALVALVGLVGLGPARSVLASPILPIAGLPHGLVWVARAPGAVTATLHWVDGTGAVQRRELDYAVNAIGCVPDGPAGAVYGLATSHDGVRLAGGPHVVRFGTTSAEFTDLGPVEPSGTGGSAYPLANGYGADAVTGDPAGPTLLVGAGDQLRGVRVGSGTPTIVGSLALPPLPYVGDWTLDETGALLTVTAEGGVAQLIRLAEPATAASGTATRTALPALLGTAAYGAVALTGDRVLYALHNSGALFAVPIDRPDLAHYVGELGAVDSADATFCPPAPVQTSAPVRPVRLRAPVPGPAPVPTPSEPAPPPVPQSRRPQWTPPPTAAAPAPRRRLVGTYLIPILGGAAVAGLLGARLTRSRRGR